MSRKKRASAHLVSTFKDIAYAEAIRELKESHDFLVERTKAALSSVSGEIPLWGINLKRQPVGLVGEARPRFVGKDEEKLGEVINMAATIERLMAAIEWFAKQSRYQGLLIKECHPSTSSTKGSNDLVLAISDGRVLVRCEVCDVISDVASQNGKEKQDLKNLESLGGVPNDGIDRFICTSAVFAGALASVNRDWEAKRYRYAEPISIGDAADTTLLKLIPAPIDLV